MGATAREPHASVQSLLGSLQSNSAIGHTTPLRTFSHVVRAVQAVRLERRQHSEHFLLCVSQQPLVPTWQPPNAVASGLISPNTLKISIARRPGGATCLSLHCHLLHSREAAEALQGVAAPPSPSGTRSVTRTALGCWRASDGTRHAPACRRPTPGPAPSAPAGVPWQQWISWSQSRKLACRSQQVGVQWHSRLRASQQQTAWSVTCSATVLR